jgi:hypothetical protein
MTDQGRLTLREAQARWMPDPRAGRLPATAGELGAALRGVASWRAVNQAYGPNYARRGSVSASDNWATRSRPRVLANKASTSTPRRRFTNALARWRRVFRKDR